MQAVTMNPKPDLFEEGIFYTTIRISASQPGGKNHSIGTGFFCRVPLGFDDRELILLISNKHVFGDPKGTLEFSCLKRDGANEPAMGCVMPFSAQDFSSNYFAHPDPDVDLACMNVSNLGETQHGLFFRAIGSDMFCQFDEPLLVPGCEAWFVGYPDGRYDAKNHLPLLRRGYLASMPKVDYNGRPQLVIDAPVYPGSSGSPVFVSLQGNFKMLGVISETMVKHGQLVVAPAGTSTVGVQQVLGLGIVIKATALKPLIAIVTKRVIASLSTQRKTEAAPLALGTE